ncbi:unnamed protein product [Macrosiphum euphorbiae]|uniref:PiggyBac transposable element-derived protein domain-containing protein n=1 Tax=Macrosiphum euphorbiae TaxID=13131 RepID=A0AAV0WGY3_9HEMI|nr:unnamed protein product [Macrosiphum euphorbiae]
MLRDEEILELLGDGNISEIGSPRSETEEIDFLFAEFENLLDNFDDENEDCLIVQDEEWIPPPLTITSKRNIKWAQKPFNQPTIKLDDLEQNNNILELKSPLQYFSEYFDDDVFENMAYHTNLYAVQKGVTRFKPTDMYEMKRLIGIHIIMGNLKYPRVRLYWQKHFEVNLVTQNMTRDRFFSLRNNLHIIDNNEIPNGNKGKFIKVRPLYTVLQKKCNSLPMERNLCVDEQMVPFKGQLSIKQYIKGKPIKWGVKVFLLCGESGTIYNILPFQGYYECDQDLIKHVGSGATVVLYLTQNVKPNRHFLFFDNFFSSFGLFERLQQLQIYAAGTIRTNWFANPPLLSDKEMRKLGRGATFEVTTDVPGCNIGIVKWFDNKAVNLGSNFIASGEVGRVTRWDKKKNGLLILKGPK